MTGSEQKETCCLVFMPQAAVDQRQRCGLWFIGIEASWIKRFLHSLFDKAGERFLSVARGNLCEIFHFGVDFHIEGYFLFFHYSRSEENVARIYRRVQRKTLFSEIYLQDRICALLSLRRQNGNPTYQHPRSSHPYRHWPVL